MESKKTKQTERSPCRKFIARNSLLTDLRDNKNICTVYNIFLTIFVGLLVNTAVQDYVTKDDANFGMRLIKKGFGQIHVTILTWLFYLSATCSTFFIFKIWATWRYFAANFTTTWDRIWITFLLLYYLLSFKLATSISTSFELPIGSAAIVLAEQVRFLMKLHSFIRNSAVKILQQKSNGDLVLPTFSQFFYFLFAPTLLYRDSYPRKKSVDYHFIFYRFLEMIGTIFFISLVVERFLNPSIQDFGIRKYTAKELVLITFQNSFTAILILLSLFFIILHSCQNLFAEITRFEDRMFYGDWWTCTNFACWFRKWNILVQEWLYNYVYKDFYNNICANSALSKFIVILISAIVHEWLLTYILGYFFPLLSLMYVIFGPLVLRFAKHSENAFFNVMMWYLLSFGEGICVTFYGLEYYANINSGPSNLTFPHDLMPRFLICNCFE